MSFERAVRAERSPVNGAYRIGKQALENGHERLVICEDPQRLTGSINLDSVLARHYANAARTVSAIGRRRKDGAVWIEVHSATTGEVRAVLGKLQWLQDWLNAGAGCLKRMTDRASPGVRFVRIASGRINIPKNSARRLSQSAIQGPRKLLRLP